RGWWLGWGSGRVAVRFEGGARTESRPWQVSGIGRHRAGCGADQKLLCDRLEIGAEMHRALVDEDGLLGWFDADIAIHRLIRELRLVRTHDHAHIADA